MDELELTSRLREEVPLASADRAEHAFLTSVRGRGSSPVRRHGLAHRRRTAGIVIAAAAAAGLVAAGLTLLPGNTSLPRSTALPTSTALPGNTSVPGNTPGASPAAVQLLAKIAAAAAAQPNPVVRDSQFVYLKTWGAGSVCTGQPFSSLPFGSYAWM